jgi:antitoxin CptB
MAELGRVKWQCRRGLLELDLILEKFNRRYLAELNAAQLDEFRELLKLPDNDLLDLLMGRVLPPDDCPNEVLRLLCGAQDAGTINV